jgi:outer membrane protein TolC
MKSILLLAVALQTGSPVKDTVTLQMCKDSALAHHPTTDKLALADQIATTKQEMLGKNYLPQLSTQGRASYQSDVPELNVDIPRVELPQLPHDHYRGAAKILQLIYDGGANRVQKQLAQLDAQADRKKVAKQHHQVQSLVMSFYFARLLAAKNQATLDSTMAFLQARYSSLQAAVAKGVATKQDLYLLEVQIEELRKKKYELRTKAQTAVKVLAHLTNMPLDTSTTFRIPDITSSLAKQALKRPTLQHLSLQQQKLQKQERLVAAQRWPKISLEAQGGGGYPNPYNLFDDSFSPFYFIGLNFSWAVWDWGQIDKQQTTLRLRSKMVAQEKAAFQQRVNTKLIEKKQAIERLQGLIKKDRNVLEMKKKVRRIAAQKRERGTISTTTYLNKVSEAAQAKLTLDKHRIEHAKARAEYNHMMGQD